MTLIFIGLIFILLELNLGINILPDFVGYLLIWKGCKDLAGESKKLAAVCPVALIMTVLTAAVFVISLLDMGAALGVFGVVLELLMVLGSLLVIFCIGKGICEIETAYEAQFNGVAILNSWKLLAAAQVGAYVALLFNELVASILLLAVFLFKAVLLISAFFSQNMYKAWRQTA